MPDGHGVLLEYLFGVGRWRVNARIDVDEIYIDGVRMFYNQPRILLTTTATADPLWPGK